MVHEVSNFNSSVNVLPISDLLLQEKEDKNSLKKIENFLDSGCRFDVLEKNFLDFYLAETKLISLLKEGNSHSLYDWLRAINQYNTILISLKKFEDAFFVANILKKTNSTYKPILFDCILRMKNYLIDGFQKNYVDGHYKYDETTFEWQVENYKSFLKQEKSFYLYPLRLQDRNKKFSCEDCYNQSYLEEMYQSFLDVVQKKCNSLKKNKNFTWTEIQNNDSIFQGFFSDIFESVLSLRRKFLETEYKTSSKAENVLEDKVLSAVSEKEKQEWGDVWMKFSLSVQLQDLIQMNCNWQILQKRFLLSEQMQSAYMAYFKFLLKKELFKSICPLKTIPLKQDKFIFELNNFLFFEKTYLRKLFKFVLKNIFIILLPNISFSMVKTAISEMNSSIQKQLGLEEKNIFLLHRMLLKEHLLNANIKKNDEEKEDRSILHHLVCHELEITAEQIEDLNCDINAIDSKGRTPLFYAVCNEKEDMVRSLLYLNADRSISDYKGQTPLMKAFETGNQKIIELLLNTKESLQVKDFDLKTVAHFAVLSKNPLSLSYLNMIDVDFNAVDKNFDTPLHLAIQHDNFEAFKFLLQNGANPYLCNKEGKSCAALIQEKSKKIKDFFETYENERKVYECLLFQGILTNNLSFIEKAIEKKAHLNEAYLYKKTPIELALMILNREVIVYMMRHKCFCGPNRIKNLGHEALRQALVQRDMRYFKILLNAGADVNSADEETKQTLLHIAVLLGYPSFVSVLMEYGIDLSLKDRNGYTAFDLAKKYKDPQIESFFKN